MGALNPGHNTGNNVSMHRPTTGCSTRSAMAQRSPSVSPGNSMPANLRTVLCGPSQPTSQGVTTTSSSLVSLLLAVALTRRRVRHSFRRWVHHGVHKPSKRRSRDKDSIAAVKVSRKVCGCVCKVTRVVNATRVNYRRGAGRKSRARAPARRHRSAGSLRSNLCLLETRVKACQLRMLPKSPPGHPRTPSRP